MGCKIGLTTHGAIHHAGLLGAKECMEKYLEFSVESSTINYPESLINKREEDLMEGLSMAEESDEEIDLDALEFEPINKKTRLE